MMKRIFFIFSCLCLMASACFAQRVKTGIEVLKDNGFKVAGR